MIRAVYKIYKNFTEFFWANLNSNEFIHSQGHLEKLRFLQGETFCEAVTNHPKPLGLRSCSQLHKDALAATLAHQKFLYSSIILWLKFNVNLKWKHRFDKQLIRWLYQVKPVKFSTRYFLEILEPVFCYTHKHRNFTTVSGEHLVLLWDSGLPFSLSSSSHPFYCCSLRHYKYLRRWD